mgnify:CR=1 FL=1
MKQKILTLCGGVGGAKLAYGLSKVMPPEEIIFLVNTGDDFIHFDLYISPDLDTVMYTLAELNDPIKGWGLKEETWNNQENLKKDGFDTWFQLGDKDLETHKKRTQLLSDGMKLSDVTKELSQVMGLEYTILPMAENPVQTIVTTNQGKLGFQEYFVKHKCIPKIEQIDFVGSETAEIPSVIKETMRRNGFTGVIICPSNPYLSVDPILSIKEIRSFLLEADIPVLAISPIINNDSIKGPTSKIMKEMKVKPSVDSIAKHYEGLVDILVVDNKDNNSQSNIESMSYMVDSIFMNSDERKISLANSCIKKLKEFA